jgi:predicted HicB family RNase H-like nuclease
MFFAKMKIKKGKGNKFMDFEKEAHRYPFDLSLVSFEAGDREFIATFKDYPDIIGSGASAEEAMKEAYGNLAVYLEYLSDEGENIVPPSVKLPSEEPSGRITLRMTKSLHAALIKRADKEGMSVNSVANEALAKYLYQPHQGDWPSFDSLLQIMTFAFQDGGKYPEEKGSKIKVKDETHLNSSTSHSCNETKVSYTIA